MSKKTKAQELQEQLTWSAPHIGKDAPDHKEKAFKYCEGYKQFLNAGKRARVRKEAVHVKRPVTSHLTALLPMNQEIRYIM